MRLNVSCWPTAVFYAPVVFCCGFGLNLGTLSSAVAYVELKPFRVFLVGLFFGATSGIFSMMISALGFSGSSPQ